MGKIKGEETRRIVNGKRIAKGKGNGEDQRGGNMQVNG